MDISYIINQLGEDRENYFNSVSPPIIQTSNFAFKNTNEMKKALESEINSYNYTRGNNPTVEILRKKIAALEGTEDCLIFSSGCAAISSAVISNIKSREHIICVKNSYGWTNKLMNTFLKRFGVQLTMVDGKNPKNFENAIQENTKIIYLESPNSFIFELQDIEAVTKIAKKNNIITILDNSYSSPLNQSPVLLGCDIVVHSASKYINGHSDVVAGIICSSNEQIKKIFENEFMTLGGIISPLDAWLIIRGLRTLQIRMDKIVDTTEKVISYLEKHSKIENIYYPFHKSFPQLDLAKKQMKNGSGLFTIELKVDNVEKIEEFCNKLKSFLLACSWGGHESLVFPSCVFNNNTLRNTDDGIPFNLIRFSIGLEEADFLIKDLEQALEII